jgi:hypothetical protein
MSGLLINFDVVYSVPALEMRAFLGRGPGKSWWRRLQEAKAGAPGNPDLKTSLSQKALTETGLPLDNHGVNGAFVAGPKDASSDRSERGVRPRAARDVSSRADWGVAMASCPSDRRHSAPKYVYACSSWACS